MAAYRTNRRELETTQEAKGTWALLQHLPGRRDGSNALCSFDKNPWNAAFNCSSMSLEVSSTSRGTLTPISSGSLGTAFCGGEEDGTPSPRSGTYTQRPARGVSDRDSEGEGAAWVEGVAFAVECGSNEGGVGNGLLRGGDHETEVWGCPCGRGGGGLGDPVNSAFPMLYTEIST